MSSPLVNKTPEQLKVPELKEELKRRGLSVKGLKKDLVERLDQALKDESKPTEPEVLKEQSAEPIKQMDEQQSEVAVPESEIVVAESITQSDSAVTQFEPAVTESETVVTEVIESKTVVEEQQMVLPDGNLTETTLEATTTTTTTTNEEIKSGESVVTMETVEEVKMQQVVQETMDSQELLEPLRAKTLLEESKGTEVKEEKAVKQEIAKVENEAVKADLNDGQGIDGGSVQMETTVTTEVTNIEEVIGKEEEATTKEEMIIREEVVTTKEEEVITANEELITTNEEYAKESIEMVKEDLKIEDKAETEKPMDVDAQAQAGVKRKDSEEGVQQVEQSKRQRRWNSGKNMEAAKVSSDLSVNVGSNVAGTTRPALSRPLVSPRPENNGRVVSPSTKNPTTSLRIDRFVRPFTLKALKDLLAETGTVSDFWMDQIKTHCYVTYSSVEEAVATSNKLHNLTWPVQGGKQLTVEFVEPEEVKQKCESGNNDKPTVSVTPRGGSAGSGFPSPHAPVTPFTPTPREKPPPPPKREVEPLVTLDDLFKKTNAKPNIYYLPLTEAQVQAKLSAKT